MADLEAFLKELAELTQKHGLEIGGCGECGSPWIVTEDAGDTSLEYLTYCSQCKAYYDQSVSQDHRCG